MSVPITGIPPFQPYYPPNYDNNEVLSAMQNTALNTSIYDGTYKTLNAVNDNSRLLTGEITGVSKDIYNSTGKISGTVENHALGLREALERGILNNSNSIDKTAAITQSAIERVAGENRMTTVTADAASRQAAADTARDIMRAIDHSASHGTATTERTNAQLALAIERNGTTGMSTTERVGYQVANAVERNGNENMATTERTNSQLALAVERNGANSMHTTERTNSQLALAIERNGANAMATTERVNSQLATAVERNGANSMNATERVGGQIGSSVERVGGQIGGSVERNGGNIMTAIERVAGEGRMTTTVTDAASRQAAADSARDLAIAIERNGANSVNASSSQGTLLLGTIERNAGENRMTTVTSAGQTDTKLTDIRHSIINSLTGAESEILGSINRGTNELLNANVQHANTLLSATNTIGWENRNALTNGFSSVLTENLKSKADLSQQTAAQYANILLEQQKGHYADLKATDQLAAQSASQYSSTLLEQQKAHHSTLINNSEHYSSLMMETQKMKEYLSAKGDNQFAINQLEQQKVKSDLAQQASSHFAMNQLEQQKVKEYLSSKGDNHYASLLLEGQKSKSELAQQAATHFSINQLEAQKIKESLAAQLADAKYEALKSQQLITEKVGDCCCEVKQKIDTIDRDRLRDHLTVANNDNNLLKVVELSQALGFGGFGGGHRYERGERDRGNNYFFNNREEIHRDGRRGDDRRGDDRRGDDRRGDDERR